MTPQLQNRIDKSIELLRKAERLAKVYDPENGFFLAFSGGKDSQALYHIAVMAGVKFKAHFSPTTVDPPQLIRFIRTHYPDVEFEKVSKSMYQMAVEKRLLPTQKLRWCCAEFKEMAGAGKVTLIGIRHAESIKRSKRKEVERIGNMTARFSGSYDEFLEYREEILKKKYPHINEDQFSLDKEQTVRCMGGKDKVTVAPIIEWTDRDVWEFLNDVVKVEHCELYDPPYNQHRIGCILCPMASKKQKLRDCELYPYAKKKWVETIQRLIGGGIALITRTEQFIILRSRGGGQRGWMDGQFGKCP